MRPIALIDVGSTVIKAVRIDTTGTVVNHFATRKPNGRVSEQAGSVIDELQDGGDVRICSSANGGLQIGLVCLTRRFSGSVVARSLETVGANIRYVHELRSVHAVQQEPHVDMLVIVGGIDSLDNLTFVNKVEKVYLDTLPHDRLVYAGHADAGGEFQNRHARAKIVANPLANRLASENDYLADYVRTTYLDDIQSKRDLQPLSARSSVQIEPTPAVVSRAFARIVERKRGPELLIDAGGATTDIHYTKDLIDEERVSGTMTSFRDVGRHVYTGLGTEASRVPTLRALTQHPGCADFVAALYDGDHRRIYIDLIEGIVPDGLLSYACLFLALWDLARGGAWGRHTGSVQSSPPLNLNRLTCLGITGGAAKVVDEARLAKVLALVAGSGTAARVRVDRSYRWWTLGLLEETDLTPELWDAIYV